MLEKNKTTAKEEEMAEGITTLFPLHPHRQEYFSRMHVREKYKRL